MKVIACIFAILGGIFGLFGATAQGLFGSGMSLFTHSNEIMNNGVTLFYLSWIVIILGGLSLKFPNTCGAGLLIISLIAFSLGNIFSAPFAFIAGIFGLFAQSANKSKEFKDPVAKSERGILETTGSAIRENNNPNLYSTDNSALLNQLSQLHTLKEKNVITEQIYEQERLAILSKFQQQPKENCEKNISQEENNNSSDNAIPEENAIQQGEYDPAYQELFNKSWFERNKNLVIIVSLAALIGIVFLGAYIMMAKPVVLDSNIITSKLTQYYLKQLEREKSTKGGDYYNARNYIDSFYSTIEKDTNNEITLEFHVKYNINSEAGREAIHETESSRFQCIDSWTFQFDSSKVNEENQYTRSRILKIDLNSDGIDDYIVDGYYFDCDAGNLRGNDSEGHYILTFIGNKNNDFELTQAFVEIPIDHELNNNKIIFSGSYMGMNIMHVYDFDVRTNKWIKNKNESYEKPL